MTKHYLGVYGSGTHTDLLVVDDQGREVLNLHGSTISFKAVGNAKAFSNMRELTRQMEMAGIRPRAIARSVWGISGCDTPGDLKVCEAMVQQAGFPQETTTVVNGAVLPFWAAADLPGVVVVAGTGSVVMGIDSKGQVSRIGGWNFAFSDLGSGYWMGCALLREQTLWLDGCRDDCFTFRKVEKKLMPEGGSREEMLFRLSTLTRSDEIASYASIVLETADSPLCKRLRQEAAEKLTGYAGQMIANLRAKDEIDLKIVLAGSLMNSDCFRAQAVEALKVLGYPVLVSTGNAAMGGIRIARSLDK